MNKVKFFLALIGVIFPLAVYGKVTIKIATLSPAGSEVVTLLKKASQEIGQKTEGRVGLRIYPGGVMGNDSTVLKKMRVGQIHGATFTAGGMSEVYKDYQILSMPMLFQNYQEVDAARKVIEPKLNEGLKAQGYISMGITEAGFVYMMSQKPLTKPADLKGCKVWIPEGDPIGRKTFEVMGVPPVQIPLPDVLTGLQTGLVDTVPNSPIGTVVLQWFTKVKYLTESPLLYSYGTLSFSKRGWNKIPEGDRETVRSILMGVMKDLDKRNREETKKAMDTLRKQGIQFVEIAPKALPEMQAIADRATDALIKEGNFDGDLVKQIRDIVKKVRGQ